MKILLFGGSGQLGFEIQKRAVDLNFEVISPVVKEVNISEGNQVSFLAAQLKPDIILNCAAYTAVDKAEVEEEIAHRINCIGAKNVALAARQISARLIHISTDYVFDGSLQRPLTEDDIVNPINVYGKTKLAGEKEILSIYPEGSLIVRTSSLYGQRGVNFVKTMIDLFRSKELVRVVIDQVMSPTWSGWLAEALLDLGRIKTNGIVHASCSGQVSWYDFAKSIFELSNPRLEPHPNLKIEPILASEFQRPAKRPPFSVFNCAKLANLLSRQPLNWEEALKIHLREIGIMA